MTIRHLLVAGAAVAALSVAACQPKNNAAESTAAPAESAAAPATSDMAATPASSAPDAVAASSAADASAAAKK